MNKLNENVVDDQVDNTEETKGVEIESGKEIPEWLKQAKEGLDKEETSLDASESSPKELFTQLTPKVEKDNNGKIINVVLPIAYLKEVVVRTNQNADSKGYFTGIKKCSLDAIFVGAKANEKDPEETHIERLGSAIDPNQQEDVINKVKAKMLDSIAHLYKLYGGKVENLKKFYNKGIKNLKEDIEKNPEEYQTEKHFEERRYRFIFEQYALAFNKAKYFDEEKKTIMPLYFNKTGYSPDGKHETDKNGNPKCAVMLRLNLHVYGDRWQLGFTPFAEKYLPGVKAGLKVDPSKYNMYEKAAKRKPIASGTTTAVDQDIPDDTIEGIEVGNIEIGDVV